MTTAGRTAEPEPARARDFQTFLMARRQGKSVLGKYLAELQTRRLEAERRRREGQQAIAAACSAVCNKPLTFS